MAEIVIDHSILNSQSRGKIVVIAGGASGIGAATVQSFAQNGAHVYFSDIDAKRGRKVEEDYSNDARSAGGSLQFTSLDVRDYKAQLAIFSTAHKAHGRIDIAIYTVGLTEPKGWFSCGSLDLESVRKVPQPVNDIIDVNLTGCLYFTRIALAFLKEGFRGQAQTATAAQKSLILVSSANGFQEGPGIVAYSASKHGIIGIIRSLRALSVENFGVRINAICPVCTDTPMISAAMNFLTAAEAPMNTATGCAEIIQQAALDATHHGEVLLVIDDKGFDIEVGINQLRPKWLGRDVEEKVERLQNILGATSDWAQDHAND